MHWTGLRSGKQDSFAATMRKVLAVGLWLLLTTGMFITGRRMVEQFRWARRQNRFFHRVDGFYRTSVPEGNLFLCFEGLSANRDGEFIFVQFMRSSYTLHPRRVYVTASRQHLRGSDDLLHHNHVPDDTWLREHDATTILTFSGAEGTPTVTIRRIEGEVSK